MNTFSFARFLKPDQIVLVLSAHCDDAEIGCGGLLIRLAQEVKNKRRGIIFSGGDDTTRKEEAEKASENFGLDDVEILSYPDKFFPNHWEEILNKLFKLRGSIGGENIGLILCPRSDDRHQDHRVVAQNVWRVFRDHLILEYETPNYDGNWAKPNFYIKLTKEQAHKKSKMLLQSYPSRECHNWWNEETFLSMMRIRGIESNASYAEGLVARKVIL